MTPRRLFLRQCALGCGAAYLGATGLRELAVEPRLPGDGLGFRDDAPAVLGPQARPAQFARSQPGLVACELCPHACLLGEGDRGFCRTRVVRGGQLQTIAYSNLCSLAVDPIEKKPLYHFLPRSPVLSLAIGGCNLRCLNCQNADISQARPETVAGREASPEQLVAAALEREIPAIAYTYSEPLVWYEYTRDAAALARERGLKNVLVTAGYVNPAPLRELCRSLDAVTLDVKAFSESRYRELSGGRLAPVLRSLEIFREEGVWVEVSFLMVPGMTDSPDEIGAFARWVATTLGVDTPLHILRFRPAHRLRHLPSTAPGEMTAARERAREAGLRYVYLGNLPGTDAGQTRCPRDGRILVERNGFTVTRFEIEQGRCPCGEPVAGVF